MSNLNEAIPEKDEGWITPSEQIAHAKSILLKGNRSSMFDIREMNDIRPEKDENFVIPSESVGLEESAQLKGLDEIVCNVNKATASSSVAPIDDSRGMRHVSSSDSDENLCYGARISNGLWDRCKNMRSGRSGIKVIIDSGATTQIDTFLVKGRGHVYPPLYLWAIMIRWS
jgi:hypothetical protein